MRLTKTSIAIALGVAALGVSALAFHADPPRTLTPVLAGAQIDSETLAIVERACQNCHSERTEWPWYSHVPPASLLIHRDVVQARDRMNLTRWEDYSALEKQALLSAIGAAVRTGVMPPRRYTVLHPRSVLTGLERERVYRWTREERLRLRNSAEPAK